MRSVKQNDDYKEYLIEYDVNLGQIWLSGLTVEDFWIDISHINVWDNPTDQANELAETYRGLGAFVDVIDITDEVDEYSDD